MNSKMLSWTVIFLGLGVIANGTALIFNIIKINEQQRQINQLYVVVPALIQRGVASEQWKFYDYGKLPDGKYKMYFAEHKTNSAILIYLDPDPTKRHENELTYIYTSGIPKNILCTWTIGEVRILPL